MKSLFDSICEKKYIVVLGILFLTFNLMLTHFMPKDYALDLKFAYTPEEAYSSLGNLNVAQLEMYKFGIWALDMPYMVAYTLFFIAALCKIWNSKRYSWLPLCIMGMDFFENLLISKILKIYPAQDEGLVGLASIFTTCKWIFVLIMLIVACSGIFSRWAQKLYSPANSP